MARKKKASSTGRFGSRYGATLRRRVLDIDNRRKEPQRCPSCATRALQRQAAGLWKCRKCDLLFAGGAYVPYTDAGKAAQRAIAQRVSGDFLYLRDEDEDLVEEFMAPISKEVEEDVIIAVDAESTESTEDTTEEQ